MRVRLLADDLTGAIDSAVRFVPRAGPFPVVWAQGSAGPGSLAIDLGTREGSAAAAAARVAEAAPLLAGADIAYLKCDSLLRGHLAVELLACLRACGFVRCIMAPAFPAQRRVTRQGRQYVTGEPDTLVGADMPAQLAALGCPVALCRPGDSPPPGVSLWDAETDADLARIVAGAMGADGPTLWCGSAGLAAALAGGEPAAITTVRQPFLALIGSDHPVTASQLAAAGDWHCPVDPADHAAPAALASRLARHGAAAVSVVLPPGHARDHAAARIAETFARLLHGLPRPATLFATGGGNAAGRLRSPRRKRPGRAGRDRTRRPGLGFARRRLGRGDGHLQIRRVRRGGAPFTLAQFCHLMEIRDQVLRVHDS
ncbi:MAG: four-carbon acid sugar kinase family protein [Acetobacteraceae bacterium]